MQYAVYITRDFTAVPSWWPAYQKHLLILTVDGSLVPPNKAFWSLDGTLLDVFDNLPIVWKPRGFNTSDFNVVCKALGVRELSSRVETSLVFDNWTAHHKPVLTPYLKEWFCCTLWNRKHQKLFDFDKDQRLFNWLIIEEIPVKSIEVTYKFEDIEKTVTQYTHFDANTSKFYVYGNHDKIEGTLSIVYN
jgi:hypothetical protein